MGAKTTKRLVILLAVIVILGLGAYFGRRYQVDRMAQSMVMQAEAAERDGDIVKAVEYYRQHLAVVPDDDESQIKYADALQKLEGSAAIDEEALRIYVGVLKKKPNLTEIRRKLAVLAVKLNGPSTRTIAQTNLEILLEKNPDDGELLYLMAKTQEALEKYEDASKYYSDAIKRLPDRVEIYSRLAGLLRDHLKRTAEADAVIDRMLKARPNDALALLAHGKYLMSTDLAGAENDFRKALASRPDDAEIYVELAHVTERKAQVADVTRREELFGEARKILEDGLGKSKNKLPLYLQLVQLGRISNEIDRAIADGRRGIQEYPDSFDLRWHLANIFIDKGDDESLLEQIEELKRKGIIPALTDYLTANHYMLKGEWQEALQLLNRIQADLRDFKQLKAKSNELIARCHAERHDNESQVSALRRAVDLDPTNLTAKIQLIQRLVNQGDYNQAIGEYGKILKDVPEVWSSMARLMIYRATSMPRESRNWDDIYSLISREEARNPNSADPSVMRAEVLVAQGKLEDARKLLEQTRTRFPKSLSTWMGLIGLTVVQLDDPDGALRLLEEAKKELGDRVEFRLELARILVRQDAKAAEARGKPREVSEIEALGKKIETFADNSGGFSTSQKSRLFEGLANEALRGQCISSATRLYSRYIEINPKNLLVYWRLLGLAFQVKDRPEIERLIAVIKDMEGGNPLLGTYADSWYLAWQAEQIENGDKERTKTQEVSKLRAAARARLDDLASRRGDWAMIPLAYATLEEQDLASLDLQPQLNPEIKKLRQNEIRDNMITNYVKAVKAGQHDLPVVRRVVILLFEEGRYAEADEILSKLSAATLESLAPELKRMSLMFTQKQDFKGAKELAQKALTTNPQDYRERLWMAEILRLEGNLEDAEEHLREAIKLSGKSIDPWVALIQFLSRTGQFNKIQGVLDEAKTGLSKEQLPLVMGLGQESLAALDEKNGKLSEANARKAEAKKWYLAAEANATPEEESRVRRFLISYLMKTYQIAELETRLRAVLNSANQQKPAEVAWARRTLALTLLPAADKGRMQQALDLFGDRQKTLPQSEDRRVLIQVLLAFKDKEHNADAIELSRQLVEQKEANATDRMLLAQLYRQAGDWSKAQEQYRALLALQPQNQECLTRYISDLIARGDSGSAEDWDEADQLIERLKRLQADWMKSDALTLQLRLFKVQGQMDKAVALINEAAERPDATLGTLGLLSEELGQMQLAEQLFRRWGDRMKRDKPAAILDVAMFLARHGRHKEAIDVCEQAASDGVAPELISRAGVAALFGTKGDHDKIMAQSERVAELVEKGINAKPQSTMLLVALGNIRERQERYEEAIDLYRRAIQLGSQDSIPLNNLAWLTALRGGQDKAAIDMINRAIELSGANPDFLDTRGIAYLAAGDYQRAVDDLEKAVQTDSSPAKLVHLAQAYWKAGDKEKAKYNLQLARTKGLDLTSLHPLEMTSYRKLLTDLGVQ